MNPSTIQTKYQCTEQNRKHDNGTYFQGNTITIDCYAKYHCHQDVQGSSKCNCRVSSKSLRCQFQEYSNNQGQAQPSERQEQFLTTFTNPLTNYFADGQAFMTNGSNQSAHIMYAAKEDTTNDNPAEGRQPAQESCSCDRTNYRACTCDGSKVVTHEYCGMSGAVVNIILQFFCGSSTFRIQTVVTALESAIEFVCQREAHNSNYE